MTFPLIRTLPTCMYGASYMYMYMYMYLYIEVSTKVSLNDHEDTSFNQDT